MEYYKKRSYVCNPLAFELPRSCTKLQVLFSQGRRNGNLRNLAECFSIHNDNFSDPEWECNRPSFVVSGDAGKITISENGKVTPPSHQHSEELIEFAIDYLKNNKKQGLMKRVGRCMGYLQVAAEIEALASGADKDAIVREALLRDFNTPPFKKVPAYWLHPGLTYLKVRI